jgi:hypothetical protein
MASAVYLLCTLTSALCAALLLREYKRSSTRLLFWSGLSFAGMAVTNALVFTDFILVPQIDLSVVRAATLCIAVALLLYGLVWDVD